MVCGGHSACVRVLFLPEGQAGPCVCELIMVKDSGSDSVGHLILWLTAFASYPACVVVILLSVPATHLCGLLWHTWHHQGQGQGKPSLKGLESSPPAMLLSPFAGGQRHIVFVLLGWVSDPPLLYAGSSVDLALPPPRTPLPSPHP